jgi:two-component system LytT family response regulator
LKILIIDDSRLARLELREQLKHVKSAECVGEAANISQALELIERVKPDVILLDINMPGGNGFELLDQLTSIPHIIFVTAYEQYAVKSFEYQALDYLLKPVTQERLTKALDKVPSASYLDSEQEMQLDSQVFLKDGEDCFFVHLSQIYAFESIGNYTKVHLAQSQPCIYKNLAALESRLPKAFFFRANRGWIINTRYIDVIEPSISNGLSVILENSLAIEISRRQSASFRQKWAL